MDLNCLGVAFHVGSGGVEFEAYKCSLEDSRKVFDMVSQYGLKKFNLLDIGGGFSLSVENQYKDGNFIHTAPKIAELID